MRRLIAALLMTVLGSQALGSDSLAAPTPVGLAAPADQPTYARVIKRYGAAVREDSTLDAPIILAARCNESFLVVGSNGPWRQIFQVVGRPDEDTVDEDDDIFGWIQLDHLALGPDPAPVECADAQGHRTGQKVESYTDGGCLALRSEASDVAGASECRPDGVHYEVMTSPTGGPSDEWYELRPTTGGPNGWARGGALIPVP